VAQPGGRRARPKPWQGSLPLPDAAGASGPVAAEPPRWPALAAVPVAAIPGVGAARRRQLEALGLRTVEDVIRYTPRRYEDWSRVVRLAEVREPGTYTVRARVLEIRDHPGASRPVWRARLSDGTGVLWAVWFHQGYLRQLVQPGTEWLVHGEVVRDRTGRLVFRVPEIEPVREGEAGGRGLVPVYGLTQGLTARTLRAVVARAVSRWAGEVPECLPDAVRQRYGLVPAAVAWRDVHLAPSPEALAAARRRLAFEELFLVQCALLLRRRARTATVRPYRHGPPGEATARFLAGLPFRLTRAQERVLAEIEADLQAPRPMYRLVQGDVGSGKTVVAAWAMVRAVEGGRQAALLAPTEILAEQHYRTLRRLFRGLVAVELLTGSTPRGLRRSILQALASGALEAVVGTHALLQPDVSFRALGLAVTDEQHRFGVRQREALVAKGVCPDVLVLTATPIPRTLAMTLYGDLDVSTLDELPPGRRPVRTFYRPPAARERVYAFLREQVRQGRQAFVVCPWIDARASEEPMAAEEGEGPQEVAAPGRPVEEAECVEAWAPALAARMPDVRVAALHGRMPSAEREATMAAFARGDIQVLVCTTIVEVGVDVPNATVLVVEGADRFGLAQLHQLRGRVGRGPHPSYCILIAPAAGARLEILTRTHDGFAIAEEDLRQRGPGEVFGTRQHGLPDFRVADPLTDGPILTQARQAAQALLAEDPDLARPEHAALRQATASFAARLRD
jgi:ATP-dependent DNA helicase RecG